ncbi:hypothetical protein [Pseudoalteromonas sp. SG45-1]|uniref:hypothetical protein n=1 Tax=Pseudoalteromonas sp. SG45-1 TaxID=2760957 RepID=UPI001603C7A9|nr:hypothetical protein [Pseudoalteromonas sp. SG45-1]MBB1400703.1 hypothetical protein [Pseudoalteromonas sp. SG45-1]
MLRIILFALMLSPLTVFGCSCFSEAKSFKDETNEYDAIFTGVALKTVKISGDWDTSFYKTELKVQQVWKNKAVLNSVFIKTNIEKNSCGGPAPTIGNTFLVFAHVTKDGLYATGGCSTFMDLEQVEQNLSTLNFKEKEEWQTVIKGMWSDLGRPLVVYSK